METEEGGEEGISAAVHTQMQQKWKELSKKRWGVLRITLRLDWGLFARRRFGGLVRASGVGCSSWRKRTRRTYVLLHWRHFFFLDSGDACLFSELRGSTRSFSIYFDVLKAAALVFVCKININVSKAPVRLARRASGELNELRLPPRFSWVLFRR